MAQPEPDRIRVLREPDSDPAALVAGLARGESAAAAELWDRYSPRARRFFWRALADESDVEDLLQDTFARVFRGIGKLRDPAALGGFVLGIAANVLRMELRRRARWSWLSPREFVPETPIAPNQPAEEAVQRLRAILDDLSPDLRVAFVLRHVEHLALAEVAESMSWSLATAKRRLAKARKLVHARAANDPILTDYIDARADAGEGGAR